MGSFRRLGDQVRHAFERYPVRRGLPPDGLSLRERGREGEYERTDRVWVEKEKYTLVWQGNDVVSIDPPGGCCPLYQGEHYRQDGTRWRRMERFVSNETIYQWVRIGRWE